MIATAAAVLTVGVAAVVSGPAALADTSPYSLTLNASSGTETDADTITATLPGCSPADDVVYFLYQGSTALDATAVANANDVNSNTAGDPYWAFAANAGLTTLTWPKISADGASSFNSYQQNWYNGPTAQENTLQGLATLLGGGAYTLAAACVTGYQNPVLDGSGNAIAATLPLTLNTDGSWAVAGDTRVTTSTSLAAASGSTPGTATLTATVSPADAVGTVTGSYADAQNGETSTALPSAFTATTTAGVYTWTGTLPDGGGLHSFTAAFTPTDSTAFTTSSSTAASATLVKTPVSIVITAQADGADGTITANATLSPDSSFLLSNGGGIAFTLDGHPSSVTVGALTDNPGDGTATATYTFTNVAGGNHQVSGDFDNEGLIEQGFTDPGGNTVTAGVTIPVSLSLTATQDSSIPTTADLTALVDPQGAAGSVAFFADGSSTAVDTEPVVNGEADGTAADLPGGSHSFTATFTPTDSTAYTPATSTSAATVSISNLPLTAPAPAISGSPSVGQTLTASAGSWGPGSVSLGYQWNANGAPISGATGSTLALTPALVGESVTVTVTGSETNYVTQSQTSSPVAVAPGSLTVAIPTIAGTAKVGDKLTLRAGTWTSGTALTYQWYANNRAISRATGTTFTLTGSQYKDAITVKVTGTDAGYASVTETSKSTAKVAAGTLKSATPTITGTAKYGKRLTAKAGTWTAKTKLAYQWYAAGHAIKGATRSTFTLAKAEENKTVTVKVTGSLTGYTSVVKTSKATKKVAK